MFLENLQPGMYTKSNILRKNWKFGGKCIYGKRCEYNHPENPENQVKTMVDNILSGIISSRPNDKSVEFKKLTSSLNQIKLNMTSKNLKKQFKYLPNEK